MTSFSKITIDGDDLLLAMQTNDPLYQHYLDRSTGEIIMVGDGLVNGVAMDFDEIFDSERHLLIKPIPSGIAAGFMRDWIDTLPKGWPKLFLERSIVNRRSFRRFKDQLSEYPELRDDWHRFKEEAESSYALAWLLDENIDAELVFAGPLSET